MRIAGSRRSSEERFLVCRQPMGGTACWDRSRSARFLRRHVCASCRADIWADDSKKNPETCPACGWGGLFTKDERLSREAADTFRLESMDYVL